MARKTEGTPCWSLVPSGLGAAAAFLFLLAGNGFAAEAPEVSIQIFSDFQCPFCKMFAPAAREVESRGVEGVRTKVEFKNFPLSFHPNAQLAAQAAQAAAEQGKFWEMHDLLFANQNALQRDDLLRNAEKLHLDMKRFRKDLDSEAVKRKIESDKAEGEKMQVSGTPAFFINGKPYSGTKPLDEFKKLIQTEAGRAVALAEITDDLMSRGPADAPVTLEFFADLESPVSQPALQALNALMERYPQTVRLQFRNFPLAFHPQAALAHEAAMSAARAGHFWEFANYILSHQDSLREQDLIEYAGRLGFDEEKFAANVQQHKYAARVDADLGEGLKRGIRGSPVVFVNSRRIDGVPGLQALTEYVEAELAANKAAH